MRNEEFQKIKKHIEALYGGEKNAIKILEHTKKALKIENNFICAIKMVDYGEFEVYFEDAEKLLKELYGEEYVEKIYKTKKGDFITKNGEENGEVYLWTIYKNKIAQAFVKMVRQTTHKSIYRQTL